MRRVQSINTPHGVTCDSCKKPSDEWMEIEIANMSENDTPADYTFCTTCMDVLSLYLGINFEDTQEGFFRVNELGQIQTYPKDNN